MKTKGIRHGILLSLDDTDTIEDIHLTLQEHPELIKEKVIIELAQGVSWELLHHVQSSIQEAGGNLTSIRPSQGVTTIRRENKIVARTVRSGGRVESTGSIIVLGDVNAGAEIMAQDDIFIIGTLRGIAHAGLNGNEHAFIWARQIDSPQLRIGEAVALSDGKATGDGPQVAHLQQGQIMIRNWDK